mgnify:CR=1 FL=1
MTLEDETGIATLILRPEVYQRYRKLKPWATSPSLTHHLRAELDSATVAVLEKNLKLIDQAAGLLKSGVVKGAAGNLGAVQVAAIAKDIEYHAEAGDVDSAAELAYLRCRRIGYIFQTFNLIPVMTALENVPLPMIFAGVPRPERSFIARNAITAFAWPVATAIARYPAGTQRFRHCGIGLRLA